MLQAVCRPTLAPPAASAAAFHSLTCCLLHSTSVPQRGWLALCAAMWSPATAACQGRLSQSEGGGLQGMGGKVGQCSSA